MAAADGRVKLPKMKLADSARPSVLKEGQGLKILFTTRL
jgi:hypothetical protein